MSVVVNSVVSNAIHSWIVSGSGLSADKVIWKDQTGPRPSTPFVMMSIESIRNPGLDWRDAERLDNPDSGEEIRYSVRGMRVARLTLECFGEATGDTNPVSVLDATLSASALPSIRNALRTAKIGIGTIEPVRSLTGLINSVMREPRAMVTVGLHLTSELSELGTNIETVIYEIEVD